MIAAGPYVLQVFYGSSLYSPASVRVTRDVTTTHRSTILHAQVVSIDFPDDSSVTSHGLLRKVRAINRRERRAENRRSAREYRQEIERRDALISGMFTEDGKAELRHRLQRMKELTDQ